MEPGGWETAAAVLVSVISAAVLLEASPKLGGLLVALLVFTLLARGLRSQTIHGLS